LPIIALTADALSSERQRSAAAGMNDFVIKPFDAQALVRTILRHVEPAHGELRPQVLDGMPATRADAAVPWPEIEGIDKSDARARLSNDFGLFRSMLGRLLDEFSDVGVSAPASEPEALAVQAARLHKLRGSAGLLGAKEIQQVAREAEAACVAGEVELAADLATALAMMLQRLARSAAPLLEAGRAQAGLAVLQGAGELEPRALTDLIELLRQQNLSAAARFMSISPQLHGLLGKETYDLAREHIDNLRFRDAADALQAISR